MPSFRSAAARSYIMRQASGDVFVSLDPKVGLHLFGPFLVPIARAERNARCSFVTPWLSFIMRPMLLSTWSHRVVLNG